MLGQKVRMLVTRKSKRAIKKNPEPIEVHASPFDEEWKAPTDPELEEPTVPDEEDEDEDLEESPRRKSGTIKFKPRRSNEPRSVTDKVAGWIEENPLAALGVAAALAGLAYVAYKKFSTKDAPQTPTPPAPAAPGMAGPARCPPARMLPGPAGVTTRGAMTMNDLFPEAAAAERRKQALAGSSPVAAQTPDAPVPFPQVSTSSAETYFPPSDEDGSSMYG